MMTAGCTRNKTQRMRGHAGKCRRAEHAGKREQLSPGCCAWPARTGKRKEVNIARKGGTQRGSLTPSMSASTISVTSWSKLHWRFQPCERYGKKKE